MIAKMKTAFYQAVRNEAQMMGILFGILTFAIIFAGIFASPRLGTVDLGKYERIMEVVGLDYTEEEQARDDLMYRRVIENYAYGHFSFAKLFSPVKNSSIVYPVSLIRAFTQPFGLNFSTLYLYVLYAALAALAVHMIVKSAAYLWGRFGVIPGICLLLLLSDRNVTAYFGSLYEAGTLIVSLLLFAGCAFRGYTYRKGGGFRAILPMVLAAVFFLNSCSRAAIFIPVAFLAIAGLAVQEWQLIRKKMLLSLALAFAVICSFYSAGCYFMADPDNTAPAAAYHAVFQGILPASQDPLRDLEELGLDESYLQDIGNSFYQDTADYAHDPKLEEEAAALFAAIHTKSVLRWHLKHPDRFLRTVLYTVSDMDTMESQMILGVGQDNLSSQKNTRSNSFIETLSKMLLPDGYWFFFLTAGLAVILTIGLWVWRIARGYDRKTRWIVPLLLILSCLCAALYLPLHVALMGSDSLEYDRIVSVFMLISLWGGLLFAAGRAVWVCSVWFRKIYEEESLEPLTERVACVGGRSWDRVGAAFDRTVKTAAGSRRNTVLIVLILAAVMVYSVQFADPRAGTVNNGDYGRMMDHLDLIWTGDIYYDYDAQLGGQVIENYAYRRDFDFTKLTSLNPVYSLIYPTAVVRGLCTLFDVPFSTWYVSLLMSVVLVCCILSIVRDLYPYLGKYTLITGVGLCLVLLSESYLVWFNSLLGEGSIILGVMMVLACSVHLAVLPQGKGAWWVFILAFASMFLTTAKAQMLLALPIVLVLIAVFAMYHRPLRVGRLVTYVLACMICMGLISFKAIRVYQDNSEVSERHTVWQSIFYGALMSSDDPLGDMEELGIPLEMAADIGKHAYYADEEYVYAPTSAEAEAVLYDHINTFTMVGYYLKRPLQLLRMLDYAAGESREVYNIFRAYLGQDYAADADTVDRWGFWLYWRPMFTFAHFWQYVLAYGSVLIYAVWKLCKKEVSIGKKMLIMTFIGVMLIGAFQFPLTTIGNGYADNHKQLFGFMLCHDLMLMLGIPVLIIKLRSGWIQKGLEKLKPKKQRLKRAK